MPRPFLGENCPWPAVNANSKIWISFGFLAIKSPDLMVIHASHHVVLLSIHVWHYYIEIIKKKWVMSFLWVPRLHQSNYLSLYVQVIFLSLRHNYIACFIICKSWCSCNLITLLMWSRTTRPFVEPLLKSTLDPNFFFFFKYHLPNIQTFQNCSWAAHGPCELQV